MKCQLGTSWAKGEHVSLLHPLVGNNYRRLWAPKGKVREGVMLRSTRHEHERLAQIKGSISFMFSLVPASLAEDRGQPCG